MSTGIAASASSAASSLATAASSTSSTDASRKTIAQNFDAFLSLLTTQLRNQNPLDPMDANQFTQQLVQFSGVEQQLKTNDLLSAMAKNIGGTSSSGRLNASSAASLIGTRVAVDGSTAKLTKTSIGGYETRYPVTTQSNYSNYQVSITSPTGEEVYAGAWTPQATGDQNFVWNGKRNNGALVDTAQSYTITVSGETSTGVKSRMSTERSGIVNSVDLSGSEDMVQFGDYTLPLSQIKKVSKSTL
jgi:flagellar basal-body rod modification protein FlgD